MIANTDQPLHSTPLYIQLNDVTKIQFHGKFIPLSLVVILKVYF